MLVRVRIRHRVLFEIYLLFSSILAQNILIYYVGKTCEKNAVIKIKSKVISVFFYAKEFLGAVQCVLCIAQGLLPYNHNEGITDQE